MAGECLSNIPTAIQSGNNRGGFDVQPPSPVSNAGRSAFPGDDPGPTMMDASLVTRSPVTIRLAPGLLGITSHKYQTGRSHAHVGQESLERIPLGNPRSVLQSQVSPCASGAVCAVGILGHDHPEIKCDITWLSIVLLMRSIRLGLQEDGACELHLRMRLGSSRYSRRNADLPVLPTEFKISRLFPVRE